MSYTFTQTGAQIQTILNQVGTNTNDIATLNTTLTNINTGLSRNSGSTVSVPNNDWTLLQSLALTQGTWLVIGGCSYSANTTGQRSVVVTSSSTAPSSPRNGMRVAPTPGGVTTNLWHMEIIVASPSATAYLWGVQASGGALNCFPYINAIRLR